MSSAGVKEPTLSCTHSTVVIQHIITKGTIDKDVMKALEKKDVTQEALMASVRRRIETNDDDSMGGAHEPIQV